VHFVGLHWIIYYNARCKKTWN